MTSEVEAGFPEGSADANTDQAGQTSTQQQGAQSCDCADEDRREIGLETHNIQHRQQLEFQDSNLSPGLLLLPTNHEGEPPFTEYSLFQQSLNEFAPLRPVLDASVASERLDRAPQNRTARPSEQGLLSECPLTRTTLLSESEMGASSRSQHSVSQHNEGAPESTAPPSLSAAADRKESPPTENAEPVSSARQHAGVEAAEDEAFFLKKEISARHLLELLQKDMGVPTDSSSTVSSECVVSGNISLPLPAEPTRSQACQPAVAPAETPPEAPREASLSRKLGPLVPEDSNVTAGPRSTRPDQSSEALHRQLLTETEQPDGCRGRPRGAHRVLAKGSRTGPFSAGVERSPREQHPCSPGDRTDINGSYLAFLPQSQSTPGIFKAPPKSSIKAKAAQLLAIQSATEHSSGSDAGICPQASQETDASAEVPSLPSVSYAQKVDAWRANQTSGKTSLLDSLALQGSSGLPSKTTTRDATSDTPNRLPSEKVTSFQQPWMSRSPSNQSVTESSAIFPPGSASARGTQEALSGVPGEKDNTGGSTRPSALLSTASPASLSTAMSARKVQGTRSRAESEPNLTVDIVQREPGAQPSALLGLGRLSDASAGPDPTPSTSQDSSGSGMKLATSIGTSSAVSLEVDNYAPYWTPKASTPPPQQRPPELNIEERIPLYLQNLGIDQSPSMILTPFVPRGPIREPEFSPTDLCTIKGSIGTPTKSTQTSEVASPNKAEFSEGSVRSVDSSRSVAFSLDSLGPGASLPAQLVRPSTWEETQNRAPSSPQPDEDSYPSTLQTTLHQQRGSSLASSQNTIQAGDRFDSEGSSSTDERESPESSFRSSRELPDTSVGSSKPTLEMRYLPTQAEDALPAGSGVASSVTPRVLSEENALLSPRDKKTALREASFSSSATVDPRSRASRLCSGSLSDSLPTPKLGEHAADQEGAPPSQTPGCPRQETSSAGNGAAPAFVPSQAARRTEPEGCSAAAPDGAGPPQPAAPTSGPRQPPPPPAAAAARSEQDVPSPPPKEDDGRGAMSDGSGGSSLAVRVTQLLQAASLGTVASSTPSTTDQEEGKAAEWIRLKVSGRHREPPELHEEDRRRIDEIKIELLLRTPLKSPKSTDSESASSSSSGFPLPREPGPAWEAEALPTGRGAPPTQSQTPRRRSAEAALSASPPQNRSPPDLEAQIWDIAAREGVTLARTSPRAFASGTVASRRRSTSASPAPEPLHLSELSAAWLGGHPEEALLGPEDSGTQRDTLAPSAGHRGLPGRGSADDAEEAAARSAPESPARPGHVSHVHLTLTPVAASPATTSGSAPTPESPPVRRRSSASSPDEGDGSASPPEWYRNTGPVARQEPERDRPRSLSRTRTRTRTRDWTRDRPPSRSFTASHRAVESPTTRAPALPLLRPYKPKGSRELFYIPQREAEATSSDTTMESSHPGSDDAVPPWFSSDVLGNGDPGISRGVAIRHTEGIYSRRTEASGYQMQQPEHRAKEVTGATALRAWGSVLDRFPRSTHPERQDRFQPVYEENSRHALVSRARPPLGEQGLPPPRAAALDQLWESFCASWKLEDSRPSSEAEASLLERLERLSRLIHHARGAGGGSEEEAGAGAREGGQTTAEAHPSGQARRVEEPPGATRASVPSTGPRGGPGHQLLCPADGAETDAASTPGSVSTVDTARLVRAFGSRRAQPLKSSASLRRLYSTIGEQRGGGAEEPPSAAASQDAAVTAQSSSSTSTYTVPPQRGPSATLRAVRVANKGVQAGDLELVCNGTRRHTRDVGTTFPSPAGSRRISSSPSSSEGRGGWSRRRRRSKRSPSKASRGLSWFIPAEELRAEARKENVHEEEEARRPGTARFEAYGRTQPRREPLRQRQAPEDADGPGAPRRRRRAELGSKPASPAAAGLTLQEALAARRPDFICRSGRRLRRLALQVEARRLQEAFSGGGEERYGRAGGAARQLQPAGHSRRAVPRGEMIQRSKQIYNNLPEVRKRREEERRRAQYDSYRLKARLYNKRITSHVLGRRAAWP